MSASRRAQPFRGSSARAPSPVLDAMRAGTATPNPGASLMQSVGAPPPTRRRAGVRIPRTSANGRNLRAQWPVRKTQL